MPRPLPDPRSLAVQRLGPAAHTSPLVQRGARFVDESRRVLIAGDTGQLAGAAGARVASFEAAGPREHTFFAAAGTTCALVTCGGLCPGLNDVIRAIVLSLWREYGVRRILGFRYGFSGILPGSEPLLLDPDRVHDIHTTGGTILGTSRGPQDIATMVDTLERHGVDVLFAIGGGGTLRGARELVAEISRRGRAISVIGVPKTIDNDLPWIQRSFGFATAVNEATHSIVAAHTEAHAAVNGIGLVKLMGRHAGFIAAHATLSNSYVNFCLVPEVSFGLDGPEGLLALLERRLERREHAVIVVAEGAGQHLVRPGPPELDESGNVKLADIGIYLRNRIGEHFRSRHLPVTVKYIDPSYLIRSLPANAFDSAMCLRLGQHAVHAAMSGRTGMVVGTWRDSYTHVPLELAAGPSSRLDPEGSDWERVLEATQQPRVIGK